MAEKDIKNKKNKSSFTIIIDFILSTVIAVAFGIFLNANNKTTKSENKQSIEIPNDKNIEKKEKSETMICTSGLNTFDLPPIITNIAAPSEVWIRIEATIVLNEKYIKNPDVIGAEISTDELSYLRTITLGEIQGAIGLENIRQDFRDRAYVRSGGQINDVFFKTFVLQ